MDRSLSFAGLTERSRPVLAATAVVAVHLCGNLLHGGVHGLAGVPAPPGTAWFVAVGLFVAPAVALAAILDGRERSGGAVLTVAMAAGLAFTVAFHALLPGPDNVAQVHGGWRAPFGLTAALVAVADGAGVLVGTWLWWSATVQAQGGGVRSRRESSR